MPPIVKKRYPLLPVFWVVLTVNLVFTLIGIFVIVVLGVPDGKNMLKELFTLPSIAKHVFGILCQTVFFYYSLNYYNALMVKKRIAIFYLRYTLLMIALVFAYFVMMN